MELTLNTSTKTVSFKGRININELLDELSDLGINFMEWTIEGEPYIFTTPKIEPYTVPYIPDSIPWINPYGPITTPWTVPQEPTIWCNVCKTM